MNRSQVLEVDVGLHYPGVDLRFQFAAPLSGVTAITGRSGSGKTTLLRALAGLEPSARGCIRIAGCEWLSERGVSVPTSAREVGYVFQEPSLFPHLKVRGNLEFGYKRTPREKRKLEFDAVVELLGLQSWMDRKPDRLSGGEKQRVAIARALLASPALLLMDEPVAALDWEARHDLLPKLRLLTQQVGIPLLMVSHDLDEVSQVADHWIVLQKGRVEMNGSAKQVLEKLTSHWKSSGVDRMMAFHSEVDAPESQGENGASTVQKGS